MSGEACERRSDNADKRRLKTANNEGAFAVNTAGKQRESPGFNEVSGPNARGTLPKISQRQWKVLRLFLSSDAAARVRAVWLNSDGRSLGPSLPSLATPEGAAAIRVYRLADGEAETFRGDAMGRTVLSLKEAEDLGPCWAEPYRGLSDLGRRLAALPQPADDPPVVVSFRAPPALDQQLTRQAQKEGRNRTALLIQATTEYLSRVMR